MPEEDYVVIKAETINKQIADAILNSLLGKQIIEAVEVVKKNMGYSWNTQMENSVKQIILNIIKEEMEKLRPEVEAKVREYLPTKITNEFLDKLWAEYTRQRY